MKYYIKIWIAETVLHFVNGRCCLLVYTICMTQKTNNQGSEKVSVFHPDFSKQDCFRKCKNLFFENSRQKLQFTRVWSGSEIPQYFTIFSTHNFPVQRLLEGIVQIWLFIPNRYPHFRGGSQKCTQGTPLVKARNG